MSVFSSNLECLLQDVGMTQLDVLLMIMCLMIYKLWRLE